MTGPSVHTLSGHRLGVSDPWQEGPADLRLVPPALAAWGTAALALTAPARWATAGAVLCAVTAVLLLAAAAARRRPGPGVPAGAAPTSRVRGQGQGPRSGPVTVAAVVLLCAAAAAVSAVLHAADLRRGPLPESARRYAEVAVEVSVTADPRLSRPRVRGAQRAPAAVLVEAEAVRVMSPPGSTSTVRTPVLVVVRQGDRPPVSGERGGPGAGQGAGTAVRARTPQASWLRLLPSTRLRLRARAVPPLGGADRYAAVLRVTGGAPPRVVRGPTAPQRTAGALRAGLREASSGLSPDARALLPGLVVGDTSRVPPELDDAFRTTDLTHLLAVSGANLTIVLALLIGPPHLALRAERRGLAPLLGIPLRTTALLGGLLVLAFVVVCRPEPSVLRAAACGSVALLAIATGRRRTLLPALAAAVLLLVLYDPWLARSYGFLLSVLATGALLTIAPRWSEALRLRGVPGRLAEVLAAAAAAQAVCAPVVAVLAARVSLVAVPCNLLAELAVAPATVLGFAALAVAPWAIPVAETLAWSAGWPVEWIAGVARSGAELPGAELDWPGGWTGGLLLGGVTVAAVLAARPVARRPWLCATAALLLLAAVLRPYPLPVPVPGLGGGWPPSGWRFAVCDVGQGDALVLPAGDGRAVVVDAGPEPDAVDRCLRALGITRIPLLVLTHFHADHVAGLPGVLRGRSVGAVETTTLDEPPDQAAFVRRVARAAGIRVLRTAPGERRLGALRWRVLWPPPSPPGAAVPAGEANDASVTLLVRTAGIRLLLLGDLEPPAQQRLLAAHPGLGPVDVLKVAHHGSSYQDPALLARVRPRLALVSVGGDNTYGHPSPRTLTALRAAGAAVLRTDTNGAIAVTGPAARLGAAFAGGRRSV